MSLAPPSAPPAPRGFRLIAACGAASAAPSGAFAHAVSTGATAGAWAVPLSWLLFVAAWGLYLQGALKVRPAHPARAAFHGAMLLMGLAIFGPVDAAAADSTAMHMLQHMVLITAVAPLLVMARPLVQWRAACHRRVRSGLDRAVGPMLSSLRRPLLWATLHGAALWVWHLPAPYTAALRHEGLHAVEHACFVLSGWAFWWAVLRASPTRQALALMSLLFTLMHTGFLGAVLVFAAQPLYFAESRTLADQQLAGLLMWAPGGVVYILAAAWLARRWLMHAHTQKVRT